MNGDREALYRVWVCAVAVAGCGSAGPGTVDPAAAGSNATGAAGTTFVAGTNAPPPQAEPAAGSGVAGDASPGQPTGAAGGAGAVAGVGAGAAAAGGTGAAGMMTSDAGMMPSAPVLPAIDDPGAPGPFGFELVGTAPGLDSHTLFVPGKLGEGGIKHPIIVWTNGATGTTSFYQNLLEHFASHGFFVVADKASGGNHDPEIVEQKAGIDWVVAESERAGSPYLGKLDVTRIGVAGHSLGAVASFATAGDPRVAASIHWSGSLTGNPVGADEAWLQGVHAPFAILCGGAEARALPRCAGDFENAPDVPVFYGTLEGVGHVDVFGEPNGGQWGRGGVAFMRWALAGDETFRSWFSGDMCELCKSPWTGMSRGI